MASIYWDRDSQEAIDQPYEYPAEEQFVREAKNLIKKLQELLPEKKRFFINDRTLQKATWMLQVDVLFAFKDCIDVMDLKKHRLVGPLIRIMYENLHQVEYLNSGDAKATKALSKWFNNESPSHFDYREYIKKTKSKALSEFLKREYAAFSKLTHRTYRSLLYNYGVGADSLNENTGKMESFIWYDEEWPLRQSISMFYAIIGTFGTLMTTNFKTYGILTEQEVNEAWNSSMEEIQIPRGYLSPEAKKRFGIGDDN